MVEPISISVGTALTVVGLYSVCLQGMEQIRDARNFGEDSQKLFSLFEAEKLLFKRWGEKLRINDQSSHPTHPCLDDSTEEYHVIHSIMQNLEMIWSDGNILSKKYGIERPDAKNPGGVQGAAASSQMRISTKGKVSWVTKDKKKFELLIADVGAFIQKLYAILDLDGENGDIVDIKAKLNELDRNISRLQVHDARNMQKILEERMAEIMVEQQRFRSQMGAYLTEHQRKEILLWVGAVSTEYEFDEALRARHPGTCLWIFRNQPFENWCSHPNSVLWIHSGPGTGKTFLSATVAEQLKYQTAHPTAYFFCTHEHPEKNQVLSVLRSWIVQLAAQRVPALQVVDSMRDGNREPVPSRLWDMFRKIVANGAGVGSCQLVLDGLDECLDYDPQSRVRRTGEVKLFLEELLRSIGGTKAKLLIVSRNVGNIRSCLFERVETFITSPIVCHEYGITREDTQQDILSISRRITESLKIKEPTNENEVRDNLLTRCDGMFLWLRLASERLRPRMRPSQLNKVLSSMPPGLNQAYKRDLERISKLDREEMDRARDILRWMVFALRPLTARELFHALAVQADDQLEDDIPDPMDDEAIQVQILDLCGSLVRIQRGVTPSDTTGGGTALEAGDRTLHFVHFSAKEFLLSGNNECKEPHLASLFCPDAADSHAVLTKICLSYLLLTAETHDDENNATGRGFENYATTYWTHHYHLSSPEGKQGSKKLQRRLFESENAFGKWAKDLNLHRLGMACWYGLVDMVKDQLSIRREDLNQIHKSFGTVLHIAAARGHADVVSLLLARDGVEVNSLNKAGWPPLQGACREGRTQVVKLLLARADVNVNATDPNGSTPLHEASYRGYTDVVQLLLARDEVCLNAVDVHGWTPLFCASHEGHSEVVKLLLTRKEVNVNASDREGNTALHKASSQGNTDIARLLLARDDVKVNAVDFLGRMPLYLASLNDHIGVVQLLLARNDVEINAVFKDRFTSVDVARFEGHTELANLLLANGAHGYQGTPAGVD